MMEITSQGANTLTASLDGQTTMKGTMRTTKRTFISAALAAAAVIALVSMLSSAALGANPAEEMAKVGTTDPKGNSWLSIQNSIEQFGHPEFILRLFLSLVLAVGCAWVIAWHPRR